jgi:hypothetical protein
MIYKKLAPFNLQDFSEPSRIMRTNTTDAVEDIIY